MNCGKENPKAFPSHLPVILVQQFWSLRRTWARGACAHSLWASFSQWQPHHQPLLSPSKEGRQDPSCCAAKGLLDRLPFHSSPRLIWLFLCRPSFAGYHSELTAAVTVMSCRLAPEGPFFWDVLPFGAQPSPAETSQLGTSWSSGTRLLVNLGLGSMPRRVFGQSPDLRLWRSRG